MFDNLRRQSAQETTEDQQEEEENSGPIFQPAEVSSARARTAAPRGGAGFLGLTPMQRFVLALMLFLNVSVLGCFALVVLERIDISRLLPF